MIYRIHYDYRDHFRLLFRILMTLHTTTENLCGCLRRLVGSPAAARTTPHLGRAVLVARPSSWHTSGARAPPWRIVH